MPDKLDFIRRRGTLIKRVHAVQRKANDHASTPITSELAESELANLDKWSTQYEDLHLKTIDECQTDDEKDVEDEALLRFDELVSDARAKLRKIIIDLCASNSSQANQHGNNSGFSTTADVKLPRMDLPTFSGTYTDWSSFHDLFSSIVHSNTKISKSQKLHYLKNSLRGEAADLIKSIDITDANYDRAWKLLADRYANTRQIAHSHIRTMLRQEGLKQESAHGLRKLLDTTTKHLDALVALGVNPDEWDQLLIVLLVDRLDSESRKQWELHSPGSDLPYLEELKTFLDNRARALEACETPSISNTRKFTSQQQHPRKASGTMKHSSSSYHTSSSSYCLICKLNHGIYKCTTFLKMDVGEKRDLVKKHNLCYNCLGTGHAVGQCTSSSTCKKCNGRHHSLLHWERAQDGSSQSTKQDIPKVSSHLVGSAVRSVLSTAIVKVEDFTGKSFEVRALLDNGSELSFVTESLVQLLGIRRHKSDLLVTGIGGDVSGKSRGMVRLRLQSTTSGFSFASDLHILTRLSGHLPQEKIERDWSHLEHFRLADPDFFVPEKVDILLGADAYYSLLKDNTINFEGLPSLYETHLGWIVSGAINNSSINQVSSHVSTIDVQQQLARFWELEEVQQQPILTAEEVECDNIFAKTHERNTSGRYVVSLPFKTSASQLGASKQQAIRRLNQVERRLSRNQQQREEYNKFMDEYLSMGHMELIPHQQQKEEIGRTFYLPHHFVTKETSTSTKFRVVFDGSARTTTGTSLNETLMVGPRLQTEILDIMVRFMWYKYVFTADISKFFRQVTVRKKDQDFQRILWRSNTSQPIQEFRLTTVTYGTASAPYLASKALHQLADDYNERYPIAAEIIRRDFYVDDVMTGENTEEDVLKTQQQLIELMELGQFPLVKWVSNCPTILHAVPPEQRETQLPLMLDSDDAVKALGFFWNPASDHFFFKVNLSREFDTISKRTLLSDTAKLYDPLGWLAPVIVKAKILFQKLWKHQLGWDDPLPSDLSEEWLHIRTGLFDLENLRINRRIIDNHEGEHQLHGFCDASQLAYAASVYVRSMGRSGQIKTRLICAKTKVAPVKVVSIPRLELCGAVLLTKLVHRISKTVNVAISSIHLWTDSTVVLDWIDDLPCRWKTFVANRVSEIQGHFTRDKWNHVGTMDNPADCATKGLSALELIDFNLWWDGPHWLQKPPENWPPAYRRVERPTPGPEERSTAVLLGTQPCALDLISNYSTLTKLQRVTAYLFRFINNIQKGKEKRLGPVTPEELASATVYWVGYAQTLEFSSTFESLRNNKPLSKQLMALQPFIDNDGLLRVGGRLQHSSLSFNQKHPLLLPQKHELTRLLIIDAHIRLKHGGGQLVLATLCQDYWILNAKKTIAKCIKSCVRCFRFSAEPLNQIMGPLPASRLEASRPFLRTGLDYGGPFTLKTIKGRAGKSYKSYLALFVCFSTKAVHLELVTDLTSEAFIAALRRFVARRGKPLELYSDNGTNFVGANTELKALYEAFNKETHNKNVADHLATEGTKWTFIPPRAPHHGGLWEAAIKSTKVHMRKVIGDSQLTYEEMTTVLHQIEACLNSRPITPMSTDPNDFTALTPGHFLVGESLVNIPEPNLLQLPQNRLSRFQLVQQQTQHFWKRWQQEYLHTLQQRTKWTEAGVNVREGDLLLLKEDHIPPLRWPMARVVELHPGKDGAVRVVTIKTPSGNFVRDVRKLCRLPLETVEVNTSRRGECLETIKAMPE